MESHANSLITNGQINSTYQRGYDVILCKLDLNIVPLTQDLGFTGVSKAAFSKAALTAQTSEVQNSPQMA